MGALSSLAAPQRVVLDTNVIMALWHFRDPALALLRAGIDTGQLIPITRADCLDELARVLAYVQFRLAPDDQIAVMAAYRAAVLCIDVADEIPALPQCRDRDDQKFIELAWQGEAVSLITRDKLLLRLAKRSPLRERFAILTPERWVQNAAVALASAADPT